MLDYFKNAHEEGFISKEHLDLVRVVDTVDEFLASLKETL